MTETYEESTFLSGGAELRSFLWRPSTRAPLTWVLMAHGLTNSHEDAPLFAELRTKLLLDGHAVFTFDFLGSGLSEGAFEDKTWENQRQNLADGIDALTRTVAGPADRIALFGRSVGGTLCSFFLNDPRVSCGVISSPPVNLVACFGGYRSRAIGGYVHMPSEVERSGQIRGDWKLPEEFFDALASTEEDLKLAARSATHVLVTHGGGDPKVHVDNSLTLFELLAEPKQFILVDGANHYYGGREQEVVASAANWIAEHTGGPK